MQELLDGGDIIGLVIDGLLTQGQSQSMADRRKQMDIHRSLFLTAAQSLSINGNALQRPGSRGFLQNALGPLPDLPIKSLLVETPKNGVERSHTRGFSILEPQSQREFSAIM